ncbi:hypothetical protein ACIQGW_05070 [Lysinibacillus xylanilyticus]|uniref:hypothetical protein n=1 Tax=Lysinibacillus xylanilyticus TaxID=582475 RepID=UPI003808F217
MKIEVTHVIKADPQVVKLFSAFLGALGTPSQNIKAADAVEMVKTTAASTDKEETTTSTKATKRTYLFHEESGTVLEVNKGEELAKHLEQGLVEITKAEYDRIQAEKQARIKKAKEQADDKATNETLEQTGKDESDDHGITFEMVRAEAKKLASSGRQADLKAILTSFDAPKLTAVPEDKFLELLAAIKEAVGEE